MSSSYRVTVLFRATEWTRADKDEGSFCRELKKGDSICKTSGIERSKFSKDELHKMQEGSKHIEGAGADNGLTDRNQVQVTSNRVPNMPAAPQCKGADCETEENLMKPQPRSGPGFEARQSWDKSNNEAAGGNIEPLVRSIEHLERLGETVTEKYDKMKTAHVANQLKLNSNLDSANSDAKKSFAIKVAMATKFSQEVLKWNSMAMKSKHTQEVYSVHMASLGANIQTSLDTCGAIVSQTKMDTEKEIVDLGKKIEEVKANIETLKIGVDTGSVACKDAKQTMVDNYEMILSQLEQGLQWMNKMGMAYIKEMEDKISKEIAKHDEVKNKIGTAQEDMATKTKEFNEEVAKSLTNMKSEEDKMFKTMDAAIAVDAAAHPDGTTTTSKSNDQGDEADVAGAKAIAAEASVGLKKEDGKIVADIVPPVEATEFLALSAGVDPVHPFAELNAAFAAPKPNEIDGAAENIDTSKYSLGK